MLDKQFDKIIKQKLDDLQMKVPGSDWNTFSQKLKDSNQQMLDDAAFDKAILDKVSEPNITLPPADWTGFQAKLQGAKGNELTDSEFDSFIQDRLELETTAVPQADWAAFSQKMKSSNLSDSKMDQEIKSRLGNYATNYNESHWQLLRSKLVDLKQLRKNILSLKWYEGLIAILLFITYANFIAESIHPETNKNIHIAQVEEISSAAEVIAANDNARRIPKEIGIMSTPSVSTIKKNTSGSSQARLIENKNAQQKQKTSTPVSATDAYDGNIVAGSDITSIIPPSTTTTESISPRNYENNGSAVVERSEEDVITLASLNSLANISALSWDERVNPLVGNDLNFAEIVVEEEAENLSNLNLHIYSGTNYQSVTGPRDTLFGKGLAENTSNTVIGFGLSKSFNAIEFMAGLKYQTLSYNPKDLHEVLPGPNGEPMDYYLNQIDYKQLSIPVGLRWHQPLANKLDLVAELGLNVNLIMASSYEILQEEIVSGTTAPQPISQEEEDLPEFAKLNRKDLFNGLAQGGSLKQTLYTSFNSGIGLEYSLTDQIALYGTANLDQMIGNFTFATNSEKINSVGLKVGMKYNFLKK